VEGWKKVLIDGADGSDFLDGVHATFDCIGCHSGKGGKNTKDDAHVGLIADPSDGPDNVCLTCHETTHQQYEDAIHYTQAGYFELFEKRSGEKITDDPGYMAGYKKGCAGCHVSCGDCHISSPKPVGGGLVRAHKVDEHPDMVKNCTACHGSRVGDEYYGNNEYAGADLHRIPQGMDCVDCHSGTDMHGDGTRPTHRYDAPDLAKCTDCHGPGQDDEWDNVYHTVHMDQFSCQVCHSQSYKSCNGCHAGQGITGSSYPTFKIGYNPRSATRPEKYVVLRHVPVVEDTYAAWGMDHLSNFDTEPTWKMATPHNLRRRTDRTPDVPSSQCGDACHNSDQGPQDFFLRASDLAGLPDAEQRANQALVVPDGTPDESW